MCLIGISLALLYISAWDFFSIFDCQYCSQLERPGMSLGDNVHKDQVEGTGFDFFSIIIIIITIISMAP